MKRHFHYRTFTTREDCVLWAKGRGKRKYTISELNDGSGWVITFNEWY